MTWHLVTGEYPPCCGGVGDYTALVARGLAAAGDRVRVWTPRDADAVHPPEDIVHALPDRFGDASRELLERAWKSEPGVILVEYVPNAFGARGANLAFCRWLRGRARNGADVRVMFHEPYFYFSLNRPWRNALAAVQRMMAAELIRASRCLYLSSTNWIRYLTPYGPLPEAIELPIPSTIPRQIDPENDLRYRTLTQDATDVPVIGHFGTYGEHVAAELGRIVGPLAESQARARFAFIGRGSVEFLASVRRSAPIDGRAWASGRLDPRSTAAALRACDLLVQPYPDGVTTRRTSVMAGLHNEVATLTTDGALTERVWRDAAPVALAPAGDPDALVRSAGALLADADARRALAERGRRVYDERFSLERTIGALRASVASPAAAAL